MNTQDELDTMLDILAKIRYGANVLVKDTDGAMEGFLKVGVIVGVGLGYTEEEMVSFVRSYYRSKSSESSEE